MLQILGRALRQRLSALKHFAEACRPHHARYLRVCHRRAMGRGHPHYGPPSPSEYGNSQSICLLQGRHCTGGDCVRGAYRVQIGAGVVASHPVVAQETRALISSSFCRRRDLKQTGIDPSAK